MITTLFLMISYYTIGIYVILIAQLILVWKKLKQSIPHKCNYKSISVIIVFRNEEKNLGKIISQLLEQKISNYHFEIILINDHSMDSSCNIVESLLQKEKKIRLLNLAEGVTGKKNAIQLGVHYSQYPWIATLDADVEIGLEWLNTLQTTSDADLQILPLTIKDDNTLFGKLQALEFMSLVGTTASMCNMKIPVLCNGANLLFSKEIYLRTLPLRKDIHVSSGDDMFLMQEVKKIGKIEWIHDLRAMAKTNPCENLSQFINQRIRWANKSKHYKDKPTTLLGILILLVNTTFLISGILSIFGNDFLASFLIILFAKTIVDFILIDRVAHWINMRHLLKYYFLVAILYPVYAVGIPLVGIFMKPEWKGRRIDL